MRATAVIALAFVTSVVASDVVSGTLHGRHAHVGRNRMRKRCRKQTVLQPSSSSSSGSGDSTTSSSGSTGDGSSSTSSSDSSSDGSSSNSDTTDTSPVNSTSSHSSSSARTSASGYLGKNCNQWNWYPNQESATVIDNVTGKKSNAFGYYAHIEGNKYQKGNPSTYFTGKELTGEIDEMKKLGSVFVPSVMPTYGWGGLTSDDNTQAMQVVETLKQFTDAGIEVWLRFGHEMNWYQEPNTDDAQTGAQFYSGNADNFLEGWKTMAAAIRSNLPQVKMFWSPNIGDSSAYAKYWPGADTVDIIGVDYYPKSDYGDLASHVQDIHDTYAKANNLPFYLGETGTTQGDSTKMQWVQTLTSEETCNALPNFKGVFWFNYVKGGDFRVVTSSNGGITSQFMSALN